MYVRTGLLSLALMSMSLFYPRVERDGWSLFLVKHYILMAPRGPKGARDLKWFSAKPTIKLSCKNVCQYQYFALSQVSLYYKCTSTVTGNTIVVLTIVSPRRRACNSSFAHCLRPPAPPLRSLNSAIKYFVHYTSAQRLHSLRLYNAYTPLKSCNNLLQGLLRLKYS